MTPLDQIAQAAVLCESSTGCPAEISTAQCALESGWLKTMSGANNCFGIKSNPGIPNRELVATREWFTDAELAHFLSQGDGRTAQLAVPLENHGARKLYHVQDWFAAFDCLEDCFAYHGKLLQRGVYLPSWEAYQQDRNLAAYVQGIAEHYATDPQYATQVLRIIGQQNVLAALLAARKAQAALEVSHAETD